MITKCQPPKTDLLTNSFSPLSPAVCFSWQCQWQTAFHSSVTDWQVLIKVSLIDSLSPQCHWLTAITTVSLIDSLSPQCHWLTASHQNVTHWQPSPQCHWLTAITTVSLTDSSSSKCHWLTPYHPSVTDWQPLTTVSPTDSLSQ